jgi:hypothetical protein
MEKSRHRILLHIKRLLLLFILIVIASCLYYFFPKNNSPHIAITSLPLKEPAKESHMARIKTYANELKTYAAKKGFSTSIAFLIDTSLRSGRKRFFVYNLQQDTLVTSGLVAHGSCNERFLKKSNFSNTVNSGCSSEGIYKVGYAYKGRFGQAYKLHGLDSSNQNAFERSVVLHGYSCVPDYGIDPMPLCNSLGCPMVSYAFLEKLKTIIDPSQKPILLWIYP